MYDLFQGHVAVGFPGSDGGGSEKSRENHKVCDYKAKIINLISYHSIIHPPPIATLIAANVYFFATFPILCSRSAYLFAHDPNTVKSELNKAMALARSKSDLG